jgi:tetratricopeptide (TPR) repeat protein
VRDRFQEDDGWGIEEQPPEQPRQHPRQQTHPSRERPPPSSSETNYQQQADKLIAQASEISSQIFQRANAFWKGGKSRVAKAYEDRAASSLAGTTGYDEGPSGKPRWMREDLENDQAVPPGETGFRDGEADSIPVPLNPPAPTKARPQVKPSPPDQTKKVDLFSEDTPTAYVSPFRRGAGSRSAPVQAESLRAPSPIRPTQRNVISASLSAISTSAEHKATGTDMFKLGRFAEAEAFYTSAISRLPDSHLLLVPLLNNRGLSRLKTGNMSGAIEDFTAVIVLVGPSYNPGREAKVTREEDGAGVDLGDALGKAWRRRAEAYEGREKWDLARQDWESIVGAEFSGRHRGEALGGIGRCKKMLSVGDAPDVVTSSAPRVNASKPTKRPAPRRGPTPPSEAVARLKQANQEAEAEEQARLELKDSVDSRLATWKNGKETNLRALVASLDTVLWPELGWQKVGMAELVTSHQVKIRYTKAIAKLHPDKVRPFLRNICWTTHISTLARSLMSKTLR